MNPPLLNVYLEGSDSAFGCNHQGTYRLYGCTDWCFSCMFCTPYVNEAIKFHTNTRSIDSVVLYLFPN